MLNFDLKPKKDQICLENAFKICQVAKYAKNCKNFASLKGLGFKGLGILGKALGLNLFFGVEGRALSIIFWAFEA